MGFKEKKTQSTSQNRRRGASGKDSGVTIITPGCHFAGKLFCRGASRIGGKIEGEIVSEGTLIIEEEAEIHADVQVEEAIIQGTVKGRLVATGRVELAACSQFEGDIVTPVLIINEGAIFNGQSSMNLESATESSTKTVKVPELQVMVDDQEVSSQS